MMRRDVAWLLLCSGWVLGGAAVLACSSSGATPDSGTPIGSGLGTGTGSGTGTTTIIGLVDATLGSASGSGSASGTGSDASDASAFDASDGGSGSGTGSGSGSAVGSGSGTGGSGTGSGTSTGSGSGSGVVCYKAPTRLHPESEAGVYCPFSAADAGGSVTCAAGDHCCEPPTGVSLCEPAATVCPVINSTDWNCEGTPDCAASAGTVCCGTGMVKTQAAQPTCGDGGIPAYPYVIEFTGSSCATSCAATYQICSKDSECPAGAGATGSCVPIEPKGGPIGYCM